MYKYNLKDFLKIRNFCNEDWFSNAHFMLNKKILTSSQRNMLERMDSRDISEGFIQTLEWHREDSKTQDKIEFNPNLIVRRKSCTNVTDGHMVYDEENSFALNEDYYNMLIKRGCTVYVGTDSISPAIIFKDDEFVGIVLPVKYSNVNRTYKEVDYDEYLELGVQVFE